MTVHNFSTLAVQFWVYHFGWASVFTGVLGTYFFSTFRCALVSSPCFFRFLGTHVPSLDTDAVLAEVSRIQVAEIEAKAAKESEQARS